jgi:hypothetical protein
MDIEKIKFEYDKNQLKIGKTLILISTPWKMMLEIREVK